MLTCEYAADEGDRCPEQGFEAESMSVSTVVTGKLRLQRLFVDRFFNGSSLVTDLDQLSRTKSKRK